MSVGGGFDAKADRYPHFKMGLLSCGLEPDIVEVCLHTKKKASILLSGKHEKLITLILSIMIPGNR